MFIRLQNSEFPDFTIQSIFLSTFPSKSSSLIPQPPSPIQWGHRSGHLWGTLQEPAEPGPHRCGPHHLRDAGAAAWATGRAWSVAMRSTLLVDDFYLGEHTNLYLGDSNIPPAESLFIPVYDTSKSATHWRKVSLSLPAVSHDDPGGAWIELPERGLKQVWKERVEWKEWPNGREELKRKGRSGKHWVETGGRTQRNEQL